ncbi:hypothetical protein M0O54_20190, partial [Acinetobacter lactucae]
MQEQAGGTIFPGLESDSAEHEISIGGQVFKFDALFKPDATQENVYEAVTSVLMGVLSGYN